MSDWVWGVLGHSLGVDGYILGNNKSECQMAHTVIIQRHF